MMHHQRARPILAVCAALVVGVRAETCWPGQACYWTKLASLTDSAQRLQPAFTPETLAYTLYVPDQLAKSVIVSLGLDLTKYDPTALPKVEIEDKAYAYNPLSVNSYTVNLTDGIGPYDKVLHIKVADPKGPTGTMWLQNPRATAYTIRITQPPEVNKVVKPVNMTVVDKRTGSVLQLSPPFNPQEPIRDKYTYKLEDVKGIVSILDVSVKCSVFATDFLWDGVEVEMNSTRSVPLMRAVTRVSAECKYDDQAWVPVSSDTPIALSFHLRMDLSNIKVSVKISENLGYCTEGLSNVTPGSGHAPQKYFECRTAVPRADLVVLYSEPRADAYLVNSAGGRVNMHRGQMRVIDLPEHGARSEFTLEIEGDNEPLRYRLVVIQAAMCSTLQCPIGRYPRPGIQLGEAAKPRLCSEETCSGAADGEHCCAAEASCTALTQCPGGKVLRPDAAKHWCHSATCSMEADAEACCGSDKSPEQLRWEAQEKARREAEAAWNATFDAIGCRPEGGKTCHNQMCFYDETCRPSHPGHRGLGCKAAGMDVRCRFCGFKEYLPCPEEPACFDGLCENWTEEKLRYCFHAYGTDCPETGRWAWASMQQGYEVVAPVMEELAGARRHATWVLFAGTLAGLAMLRLCAGGPCSRGKSTLRGHTSTQASVEGQQEELLAS